MSEAKAHFSTYSEYNTALRAWFVGFGIGGPALLLVNPGLLKSLADANVLQCVAACFLVGAACQILIAFINKVTSWCLYYGAVNSGFAQKGIYKFIFGLSKYFIIDVALDLVTIVAFGTAVIRVFNTLSQ